MLNVAPTREGPRINEEINVLRVRLVDDKGRMVGVVGRHEALTMAAEAGLDLVEIAPSAEPPVCKILDYGKYKYEEQKKKNEARKKQKVIEVKEIKLRPSIDDHDYEVKMRSMVKFIEEGDKVKVTMRFRGRELAHQELGMNVLVRVRDGHRRPPRDRQPSALPGWGGATITRLRNGRVAARRRAVALSRIFRCPNSRPRAAPKSASAAPPPERSSATGATSATS
jgi:translation initiation factor IF-3